MLFVFITAGLCANAQSNPPKNPVKNENGYVINAILKPYKNCWVYLGTYYAKTKFWQIAHGSTKGAKPSIKEAKITWWHLFFVTPNHSLLFEILLDDKQHFSIKADSAHLENIEVTGSEENTLFAAYSGFLTTVAPQLNTLQQQLKTAKGADSIALQGQLKTKTKS